MNEVWNLDRMYTGFDDPKYAVDFAAFKEKIAEFVEFTGKLENADPLEGLRTGIRLKEELDVVSDTLSSYPHLLAIPAVVISLVVLSLNLFGDGLRDAFDPKLKN